MTACLASRYMRVLSSASSSNTPIWSIQVALDMEIKSYRFLLKNEELRMGLDGDDPAPPPSSKKRRREVCHLGFCVWLTTGSPHKLIF